MLNVKNYELSIETINFLFIIYLKMLLRRFIETLTIKKKKKLVELESTKFESTGIIYIHTYINQ